MRIRLLSLAVMAVLSAVALAQQPPGVQLQQPPGVQFQQPPGTQQQQVPPQPTFDPANNKLDGILYNWEKAMGGLKHLHAQVTRTARDKVFMTTEVYSGWAKYLAPNKAALYLKSNDPKKPQEFEMLVCNGQTAYKWEPSKKEIHIHQLPAPKQGQINDDNFVSMLFGMKALDAKRRYDLQLLQPPSGDTWYHYVLVVPRDPIDKAEFTRARMTLFITSHLPREIYFEQPNGNDTKWDFPTLDTKQPIDAREFDQPKPLSGWQLKKVDLPQGPRVIRPQDGK